MITRAIIVLQLTVLVLALVQLRRQKTLNVAVNVRWTQVIPHIRIAHGRGWVYSHNGDPLSVDEMALSMGDDLMKAHPGEFKKIGSGHDH